MTTTLYKVLGPRGQSIHGGDSEWFLPNTSHRAALFAAPKAETHRVALRVLKAHPDGLTDFDLARLTGIPQTSIGVRRKELVRMGLVEATDKRRPAPSGAKAIVWRAL